MYFAFKAPYNDAMPAKVNIVVVKYNRISTTYVAYYLFCFLEVSLFYQENLDRMCHNIHILRWLMDAHNSHNSCFTSFPAACDISILICIICITIWTSMRIIQHILADNTFSRNTEFFKVFSVISNQINCDRTYKIISMSFKNPLSCVSSSTINTSPYSIPSGEQSLIQIAIFESIIKYSFQKVKRLCFHNLLNSQTFFISSSNSSTAFS